MKVTYSNGYPSLNTLQNAWEEYDRSMSLMMKDSYKHTRRIAWQDENTNRKVDGFIAFLLENGIRVGKFRLYSRDESRTGYLEILPKLQ